MTAIQEEASKKRDAERVASVLFFAGCATIPIMVLRIGPLTISDLLFGLAWVAVLLFGLPRAKPDWRLQVAVAMVFAGVVLGTSRSQFPLDHAAIAARLLYVFVIWQWTARSIIRDQRRAETAIRAYLAGAALSSMVAVAQLVGFDVPGTTVVLGRAAGLSSHPNGQGGVLALAAVFAFALFIRGASKWPLLVAAFASSVTGLILSASVSGMIAAVIGIVVFSLWSVRSSKEIVIVGVVGVVAWVVAQGLTPLLPRQSSPIERLLDTTGNGSGESTFATRILTDDYAASQIVRNPIVGVGLDPPSGVTFDGRTLTHNLFLLAWFQGGLMVFLGCTLMIAICAVSLRLRVADRTSVYGAARSALWVGLLTMLVFSMTGPVLYERWFWFPALLALSAQSWHSTSKPGCSTGLPDMGERAGSTR